MPWSTAIESIVTQSVLNNTLGNYATSASVTNSLGAKLNIQNGVATNLRLSTYGSTPDSVVAYGQMTTITNDLQNQINGKASLAGAGGVVSFTVPVTAVAGSNPSNVVLISQLIDYVRKDGSTITAPITLNNTSLIMNDGHLTNVKFVNDAIAAALGPGTLSVQTTNLDDYTDKIATTKFVADKIEQSLTGSDLMLGAATATTPDVNDDSDHIATTEWVREYIAQVLGGSAT